MNLHETIMGQRLIEGTLPDIAYQLKRIADSLEKLTESKSISPNIMESIHMMESFPMVDPFTSESNRYESSVSKDYDNHLAKLNQRGYITQALLDFVDRKGAVSHGELESYYKSITGSNSFSHILANLRTPYKNRKTQRYISKEGRKGSNANWVIKVANPSNWVVIEY
jgi:hypothetical protein